MKDGADGEESDMIFFTGTAKEYMKVYDDYITNLILEVHLRSGMPARATESAHTGSPGSLWTK